MANTISAFYQTLVAATEAASQLLAPTWKASTSVYMDYRSEPATIGQTIDVAIPSDPTSAVADAGLGDLPLTDIAFTTVPITFDQHPEFGYLVRDFEQFNSPLSIRNVFLDAALKGVKSYINNKITSKFTTGNFTTNSAISTTSHLITTAQFLSGMAILADQKVPVADDPAGMSLLVPSTVYTAILGDSNWTQAQIAGMKTAEFVRETGVMPTAYGMTVKLDQQMPTSGSAPSRTFTCAYMHKWAIALVARPLPAPDQKVVDYTYVDFAGIPIRVQLGYNQLKGGYVVTIDAGFGLKVVRDSMCQLFSVAE